MASSRTRVVVGIVASLLVSTSARAEPTAADRETARTLMAQGVEARAKGDPKEALKRFRAANDIMHVPTTALEVARSQVAIGKLVEARDTVASIRQMAQKPNEPPQFTEARARAEELDASLNGRIPALNISIKGSAENDTLTLLIDGDDVPVGVLGLPRVVDPGHHVVIVKTAHALAKQELDVGEGEQKAVGLTLLSTGEPPAPGEPSSTTPTTEHEASVAASESHSPTFMTWAGVALTGVGVVEGTVTGVMSLSKKSALQGECTNNLCGSGAKPDYDAAKSLATASTIGFIGAGVGAAIVVVTLIVGHHVTGAPEPAHAAGATIAPWIGLGGAGVSGTF